MPQPKLPNMNEFSPGVGVELKTVLQIAAVHSGDRDAQTAAIIEAVPRIAASPEEQRGNRANNVLIGMSQCSLYDLQGSALTDLGSSLLCISSDHDRHVAFAAHLIRSHHGDQLIDVAKTLQSRGENVTLNAIRVEFRARGFYVTENSSDASKIRMWLARAGIFPANRGWEVDDTALKSVVGVTADELADWKALTRPQRAFLSVLLNQAPGTDGWVSVRPIKTICETNFGQSIFPEGHLRQRVIQPLVDDGWMESEGRGPGRGGESGRVRMTPKLKGVKLPLRFDEAPGIPGDLRLHLNTPLPEIFANLEANDTHKKGIALELLALRLVRDIGFYPVAFRLRSASTLGAEVDLVADALGLQYSRWLVQCKNTNVVGVHDIAKEVGMATALNANVVLMVTTGRYSNTAIDYATGVGEASPIQVILLDRDVLLRYQQHGSTVVIDHLRKKAQENREVKGVHIDLAHRLF